LRLSGKGFPHLRGFGRGDQVIIVDVKTPTNLSSRQEELLRELAELEGDEVKPHQWTIFGKKKKKRNKNGG